MRTAYVVEIVTPRKFALRGLWFGPRKPKQIIVWVHGLGGSAFSMRSVIGEIMDEETAVLTFNNRGFGVLNKISSGKTKGKSREAGSAKEIFIECVDDIQGAVNFVRRQKVKRIFLAGHSTGCQKSVYWASKTNGGRGVRGIILLGPISDWAAETKRKGKAKIARAALAARALAKLGKKHALLPEGLWPEVLDAQRFLSLYTPDSIEEIFSYSQRDKKPTILQRVRKPLLVIWSGKDEYADRPAAHIKDWFEKAMRGNDFTFRTIPSANHALRGKERIAAKAIKRWITRMT